MKNYKNSTKIFKISLFLLGISIIFSLGINTTAAATTSKTANIAIASDIYVNGSSGNDNWNGLNSTYTSGINGPKATIKNATGTVSTNGTVYIADGTYNERNIQINTNMTIIGENQKNTIINGQQSKNSIFIIASGVNLTIINLTLTNGTSNNGGGAIYNSGTLTVDKSTFTNNTATATTDYGGAIYNNGGTLTVENSTFTNNTATTNGGAIDNMGSDTLTGTLTVENSTFTNNTALNGGAIENEGSVTLTVDNSTFINNTATNFYAGGGAINNSNSLTVENSTFTNNTARYGGAIYNMGNVCTVENSTFTNNTALNGGAIINEGSGFTVDNSTFTNNTATTNGGAICNYDTLTVDNSTFTSNTAVDGGAIYNMGTGTVNFNRIVGNSGTDIFTFTFDPNLNLNLNLNSNSNSNPMSAEDNWWGSNFAGTNPEAAGRVNFTVNKWIVLTVTAKPTTINNGANSTITADLLHDNGGSLVNGSIPDGLTVKFSSDGLGTINPTINTTLNGSANATFTGHSSGVSEVSTTVDEQTITTPITINTIPSAYLYLQITSSNKNPKVGEPFTLTYKLGNKGPDNATNAIVTIPLPSDFTISNISGNGTWTYNKTTNTIIWTLSNVTIGDPYLYITGKINTSGSYVFGSNITSETNNLNTEGVTPITITATNPITPTKPTTSTNSTILNAATNTIPMQHTGVPIAGLILAILTVIGGSILPRLKK
jgi:predicted outer membrane repeat protein